MKTLSYVVALIVALFSLKDIRAAEPKSDSGISDIDFDVKDIGVFDVAANKYRIWASLRNDAAKSPRQWQFLLEPLLQPIRKDGIAETVVNGSVVSFELALWSNDAIDRALEVIRNEFPNDSQDILRSNIRPIPLKYIHLETKEISRIDPQASIENPDVPINGFPERIQFRISASSTDGAKNIASSLPDWIFTYKISYSARVALQARATIQGTEGLINDFKSNLEGVPPTADGVRYIFRDDFRKFLESHQTDIQANVQVDQGAIADPSAFMNTVIDGFMVRWNGLASRNLASLDATSKQSTFNSSDLTPDKITQDINKVVSKASGENQFKVNASGSTEASWNKITGKASGSYSKEELEKFFRENDIDAEWTGEKWVCKDVKVRQVNDTAIRSLLKAMTVFTQILPPETKTEQSQIAFNTITSDDVTSIGGRLSDLENAVHQYNTLPIGTILPYHGELSLLDGTSWVVCDAKNAAKFPSLVPNLENRFLEGVGKDSPNTFGGVEKLKSDGAYSTTVSTRVSKDGASGGGSNFQGEGPQCYNTLVKIPIDIPNHDHGGEIRPLYFTTYYIVKIK